MDIGRSPCRSPRTGVLPLPRAVSSSLSIACLERVLKSPQVCCSQRLHTWPRTEHQCVLFSVAYGARASHMQPPNAGVEGVTFLEAHPVVYIPLPHTKRWERHKGGLESSPPRWHE